MSPSKRRSKTQGRRRMPGGIPPGPINASRSDDDQSDQARSDDTQDDQARSDDDQDDQATSD